MYSEVGDVPFIKVYNLTHRGVLDFSVKPTFIDLATHIGPMSRSRAIPNDVLINIVGPPLGKVAIVPDDHPQWNINQAVVLFRPLDGVSSKYLAYAFLTDSIMRRVTSLAKATAGQSNIGVSMCRRLLPLPIAPTNEQNRIVSKIEELFSDLDAGVAALKRAKANLKRYRAAILKAAVEGKLTGEWRAKHPAKESASTLLTRILKERRQKWEANQLAKFAASEKEPPRNWKEKYVEPVRESGLFGLPDSWTWATALEICEAVENGNTPPSQDMFDGDGEVPFIKVYNLTKFGTLDFSINPTFVSRQTHETLLGRSKILPNDVLMNIVGPPLGKVSVVPDTFPEWNTNQAVVIFRASSAVLPHYFAACLMCDIVLCWIIQTARATAGQYNISLGNSRRLPIPLPPVEEQAAIVEALEEKLSQIGAAEHSIEKSLVRATRLRQSILKQAFEGKLVHQDPKDELTKALLERLHVSSLSHRETCKATLKTVTRGRPTTKK